MIVSELIKKLEELPQDKIVLGRGYEDGWDDLEKVTTETLVKCNNPWYDGTYQDVKDYNKNLRIDTPKEYICLI